MQILRQLQRWLAALIAAAVAVQFLLAGAGAFGAISFSAHTATGWTIAALSVLAMIVAAAARSHLRATALLLGAVVVQAALGVLGTQTAAWFGALHGLNAVVVLAAAAHLARTTATTARQPAGAVEPTI
ncbi:MAG: hypothetical protein ACRDK8_02455 [Solirubrobacteraceae bacterium]